jgi:hypothetical protein
MRKRNIGLCALLACLVGWLPSVLKSDDDSVNWLGSYQEALQQARQTHKPIFLEFRCEA